MTISNKDLERKIKSLNDITDNKYDFTLESSYGAYKLASHKGSVDVFSVGLVSKKELWYHIDTFINGLTYTLGTKVIIKDGFNEFF